MRITSFVLGIALVHLSSAAYTQITLKGKNAPLEKLLTAIERQTKYVFLYDPAEVKTVTVTVNIKNLPLQEALRNVFKDIPVEFTIVGNNVLLKKNNTENAIIIADIRIHGSVVDSAGQPLTGVTVFNERKRKGTQTDSSGIYTLLGINGDRLRFSSVGYKDREVIIGDQALINTSLQINASGTDQVVVIGYGSSKKKDLTGAVSVVDVQGMETIPFNTVDNALAGKAPGVEVTKTDGTPGGMVRVRIRGASSLLGGNDPLYVIDGVPVQVRNNFITPGFQIPSPLSYLTNSSVSVSNGIRVALPASFVNSLNSLSGLDPDDIESITILKDASSAAIYGAKAANGVVIITTKTGRPNPSPTVELSYSSVISTPYKTPKLLNASQYRTLITEAAKNAFMDDTVGGPPSFHRAITDSVLNSRTWFGEANTNWIKQVTRTTLSNHVGLSMSGGGQTSKYFASIAYNNMPGVVDNTNYNRISGKFNLENQIGSRIRIAANLLAAFTSQDIGDGAYTQALLARPDLTPRDASGNLSNFSRWMPGITADAGLLNPAALLTATNNSKTVNLLGTISACYTISKSLSFRSAVSLNMQNYNQRNYVPGDIEVQVSRSLPSYTRGVSSEGNSRLSNWLLEHTLSYHKQLTQKHALNIVAGQSYESSKYSWSTATAGGFQNNNFTSLSSADTKFSIGGDEPKSPQSYLLSFYARANYSYANKYMVTFTGRVDGSSKFGSNRLYGYFPSGALAWRISRESFLSPSTWLTDLKVRGSYGLTGNQNIGDQAKHTLYTPVTYGSSSGLIPTVLGNDIVQPEITKSADIGLDISLLADRLYATLDYYNRHTSNAILSLPISQSSTYPVLTQNAAGIRNRGFELSIGGDIFRSKDVKWSMTFNVTWNKSLVTDLSANANLAQITSASGLEIIGHDGGLQTVSIWGNTALVKGEPLGLITGSYVTGIIKTKAEAAAYKQQTGSFMLPHIGDAMFQLDTSTTAFGFQFAQHNVILGNGAPQYYGGMTQQVSYKNFDLQCFFTFSHGGHLLWTESVNSHSFYYMANAAASIQDRYTSTHTNTPFPRLNLNGGLLIPTNLDVYSSSFFKLRSLVLSYRLDHPHWLKKTGMSGLRFFLSASNVFTITKYPGSDPEISNDAYSVNGGYIDAGIYPAVRTFSFGLKAALQ